MSSPREIELLLVEDNPRDAEMTLRALQRGKLANHVHHVQDGQEAIEWLHGTGLQAGRKSFLNPKLILLDLKLPKMDGLDVLRAIRADERTRLIPVVILTSSREDRDLIESYKLGVNSYIVKPVEFENFSAAVEKAGHYWLLVNERAPSPPVLPYPPPPCPPI